MSQDWVFSYMGLGHCALGKEVLHGSQWPERKCSVRSSLYLPRKGLLFFLKIFFKFVLIISNF